MCHRVAAVGIAGIRQLFDSVLEEIAQPLWRARGLGGAFHVACGELASQRLDDAAGSRTTTHDCGVLVSLTHTRTSHTGPCDAKRPPLAFENRLWYHSGIRAARILPLHRSHYRHG